jgi:hypothetical protein
MNQGGNQYFRGQKVPGKQLKMSYYIYDGIIYKRLIQKIKCRKGIVIRDVSL